jgi:hypothetical protein
MDPYRIGILTQISGVTFDEAWSERVRAEIDGIPAAFLSLRLLRRNQRACGRAKDLAGLNALPGEQAPYGRNPIISPVIPGSFTRRTSWNPASPSQAAYSGSL